MKNWNWHWRLLWICNKYWIYLLSLLVKQIGMFRCCTSVTLTEDSEISMWHSEGEKLSEIIGWILRFENNRNQMQHKKASSFLLSKNKAKIHLFRKFPVWQVYCINDKLTTFFPLCLFQPHIYLLIHAVFQSASYWRMLALLWAAVSQPAYFLLQTQWSGTRVKHCLLQPRPEALEE